MQQKYWRGFPENETTRDNQRFYMHTKAEAIRVGIALSSKYELTYFISESTVIPVQNLDELVYSIVLPQKAALADWKKVIKSG